MPPGTSNHGAHLPSYEAATVDKKRFQMTPLLSSYCIGNIYMICFKIVYLYHFKPFYVKSGERAQTALGYIRFLPNPTVEQ